MLSKQDTKKLEEKVNERPLGLHGAVWCIIAGCCYGAMQVFAKQAYDGGLTVGQFLLARHFILAFHSYILGKCCRNVDFNLTKYSFDELKFPMAKAGLAVFAKGA